MLTEQDIATIRGIVRVEVTAIVQQHLGSLAAACIAPLMEAVAQLQESLTEVSRGQLLVEKSLLPPDDNEPWRESLNE